MIFRVFTNTNPLFLFTKPFYLLLFVYFLTTSIDLYYLPVILFKFKLTHVIAPIFSVILLLVFRNFHLPYRFTLLMIGILITMAFSAANSINPPACMGYFLWMAFNFIFYFLIPYILFRYIPASTLLQIYFNSFFCMGLYALLQFVFSFAGIILPGVTQYIFNLARGQAFTYEPTFYALYILPLTIFYTTKFLLNPQEKRKLYHLIYPNLLLLVSTSTGCLFSYLIYFSQLILFKFFKIIKTNLVKLFSQCAGVLFILLGCMAFIKTELLTKGFLKFFFQGTSHYSIVHRWEGIVAYWNIFLENSIFGVGLGAGPFYYAQKKLGGFIDPFDPLIIAHYCPTNVFTEILASLGLVGILLFIIFLNLLIHTFRSTHRIPQLSSEEKINLIALALSVGVVLGALQFNQNITRAYLWVHIGIFVGYADSLRRKYQQEVVLNKSG